MKPVFYAVLINNNTQDLTNAQSLVFLNYIAKIDSSNYV